MIKKFLEKFSDFYLDKSKEQRAENFKTFGIKSGVAWGKLKDKNAQVPIFYIKKPKSITEQEFQEILNSLQISFKL